MDVLDLVLPRRCIVCGGSASSLCDSCRAGLRPIRAPLCARCGAPTAWPVARCLECAGRRLAFATARAAVAYDRAVRALVNAWKEHGLRRLDALAAELVADHVERPRVVALTFVPADGDRRRWRGHHPAERLARELGARWELPVERLLARTRSVRPQRGLSLVDRRRNVAGAFCPCRQAAATIGLVDDVYTSGATATAAASALRKDGARVVHVVTLARAVR